MIKVFKDMIGRKVAIHFPPQRIISLVPSQTELLYKIGLGDRIVGKTMYCVHTNSESNIAAKVGGTKSVKFDLINALKPDLIICNQEENTLEIVETLAQKYPVWISDVNDLESAISNTFEAPENATKTILEESQSVIDETTKLIEEIATTMVAKNEPIVVDEPIKPVADETTKPIVKEETPAIVNEPIKNIVSEGQAIVGETIQLVVNTA